MDKLVQLTFQKAGMFTTVQDRGRWGYQAFGVPIGGVMDSRAAQIANELVGNPVHTPVLEITLLGPTIHFDQSVQIAITGGNLSPKVNRQPIDPYSTISIKANEVLSFGRIVSGCRAYLAIRGAWQLPKWLDSYSAVHPNKEVLPTSLIQKNSTLQILTTPFHQNIQLSIPTLPTNATPTPIQVLPGPEFEQFSHLQIAHFFSQIYTITNDSNRMGYQLDGKPLPIEPLSPLISSGIIPSTIQINHGGLPIILMRDAQTVGGYPRIANVVATDMDVLAQLKPLEKIRFVLKFHAPI